MGDIQISPAVKLEKISSQLHPKLLSPAERTRISCRSLGSPDPPRHTLIVGRPMCPYPPWSHPPVIGGVASPPVGGLRWAWLPVPNRVTVPAVTQRAPGSLADADYHKPSAFGLRGWSPGQPKQHSCGGIIHRRPQWRAAAL